MLSAQPATMRRVCAPSLCLHLAERTHSRRPFFYTHEVRSVLSSQAKDRSASNANEPRTGGLASTAGRRGRQQGSTKVQRGLALQFNSQ